MEHSSSSPSSFYSADRRTVPPPPRLWHDLKLSLGSLYGNAHTPHPNHLATHEFLFRFQTRNVRRQIQSMVQQHRDSQHQNQRGNPNTGTSSHSNVTLTTTTTLPTTEMIRMGSSWLASLYILCDSQNTITITNTTASLTNNNDNNTVVDNASSNNTWAERLFCAQTLLHRSRSVKIVEAVDWELENWADTNDRTQLLSLVPHPNEHQQQQHYSSFVHALVDSYRRSLAFLHPLAARVVQESFPFHTNDDDNDDDDPEQTAKAQLTILTLAALSFQLAYEVIESSSSSSSFGDGADTHTRMDNTNNTTPLLSATMSTLATIAFRVCYCGTPTEERAAHPHGSPSLPPRNDGPTRRPSLLTLIRCVYAAVWKTVVGNIQPVVQHQHPSSPTTTAAMAIATTALSVSFLGTLAAIPDVILGSPGGARGRLSVDPRAIQAASHHLRTRGTDLLLEILLEQRQQQQQQQHQISSSSSSSCSSSVVDLCVVQTCAKWAAFLPLSLPILHVVVPIAMTFLVSENSPSRAAAFSFLIAVYESALCDVDQILSASMGITEQPYQQQQSKKKQTSRSKRRQKEKLDSLSSDDYLRDAQAEKRLRGEIAYEVTFQCWSTLSVMATRALTEATTTTNQVDGEGPIGCLAACASACLPFILRNKYTLSSNGRDLFLSISGSFQQICSCPNNTTVRALALEPLYTLHDVLLDVARTEGPLMEQSFEEVVVNHFFQCSMNLASLCSFPIGYFDNLCVDSDHDLEIERNDMRNLLRTITGSGEGGSTVNTGSEEYPLGVTTMVLFKMIDSIKKNVVSARQRCELFPEIIVHSFSSLAKPVNHLGKCFTRAGGNQQVHQCLNAVLEVLVEINQIVVDAFIHGSPKHLLLPLSRTVNIGNASYAPFLSAIASIQDATISEKLSRLLDAVVHSSLLSLEQLAELPGPSILKHSLYDIRGTMRGPGGEDHVGCLTLMRCTFEDDILAQRMVVSSERYVVRLCELHQTLKRIELQRGPHVVHGEGVTPQTRRILVGTLCQLECVSQGRLGASHMLTSLFNNAILEIASFQNHATVGQAELFRLSETALDLASFTTPIVAVLFDSNSENQDQKLCLEVLASACIRGYQSSLPAEAAYQWNRLRASLFALIKKSACPDLSERCASILIACVCCECESIHCQYALGPTATSYIYTEDLVSPETIPAGVFVRVVFEVMNEVFTVRGAVDALILPNCIHILTSIKDAVLAAITSPFPDQSNDSFVDPRPTLMEAWLQAMIGIAELRSAEPVLEVLIVESFVAMVSMLFYPSLGKTETERENDFGMSFDGPQSLAMTTFFGAFFRNGFNVLKAAGQVLITMLPLHDASNEGETNDPNVRGIAVIISALFRSCQGALPPWAIESIPDVFSSLFEALGEEADTFGSLIQLSMELRLSASATGSGFRGLAVGQLLAGRFFEVMSVTAKSSFVEEAKVLSKQGGSSWRKLKGLIKQACGGKKKDSHFNQKPSPTRWEFDRV